MLVKLEDYEHFLKMKIPKLQWLAQMQVHAHEFAHISIHRAGKACFPTLSKDMFVAKWK